MMQIEVGDIFRQVGDIFRLSFYLYKVTKVDNQRIQCNVYFDNRFVGLTSEQENTLLKMQKLTPLEKELM